MNGDEVNAESLEDTPPLAQTPLVFNIVGYGNVGGTALNFPLSTTALEGQIYWPYVQQWNLNVQHNIDSNTVVSVAYVGSKDTHLTDQRDLNQLMPVPVSQNQFGPGQPVTSASCGSPLTGPDGQPIIGQAAINLGVACGNDPDPYRPFLGFGTISLLESSDYNALQVYLRKTVGRIKFSLAYTYSSALDDSSDRYDGTFVNSYNLRRNYASSSFDETHMLNASYVYDVPFFQRSSSRLLRGAVGGWEISGITSFQTGALFTVTNGGMGGVAGDAAGVGNGVGTRSFPGICGNIHAAPPQTNEPGIIGLLPYNPGAFWLRADLRSVTPGVTSSAIRTS